jgi:hypothetical protein
MKIKAIETKYAGRYFRSRLEARWAIFFDVMQTKWEYENQGFSIGNDRYLPDFELPEWMCYIEIKPASISIQDDSRIKRIMRNWNSANQMSLWVIKGSPALYQYKAYRPGELQSGNDGLAEFVFGSCRKCDGLCWGLTDGNAFGGKCKDGCESDKWTTEHGKIEQAYNAAMSAKFDHKQAHGV